MQPVRWRGAPLLALLVAFACAKPLPPQQPLAIGPVSMAPGEWRTVDHVLTITDASGTMYYRGTFPEAKAITQSFVASMPERGVRARNPGSYEAGLIGFGGSERSIAPLAAFDRRTLASSADALDILGSVRWGRGGSTPLHEVLSEAQLALEGRKGTAALVIVSDGVVDSPEGAQRAAQALVDGYSDRICIHTVHVGDDPEGRAFLGRLAQTTACGSARTADAVRDVTAFRSFTHTVFAGKAPALPPVAAAGPCEGIVRLRGIQFEFDRAEITPDSRAVLDVAVEQLRACKDLTVDVIGHTDSVGTPVYNQGLSERRARSAERYFVGSGIAPERLRARGRGEEEPIAPNETSDGRAQNRRVELMPRR